MVKFLQMFNLAENTELAEVSEKLPRIIQGLKAKGYEVFQSLSLPNLIILAKDASPMKSLKSDFADIVREFGVVQCFKSGEAYSER